MLSPARTFGGGCDGRRTYRRAARPRHRHQYAQPVPGRSKPQDRRRDRRAGGVDQRPSRTADRRQGSGQVRRGLRHQHGSRRGQDEGRRPEGLAHARNRLQRGLLGRPRREADPDQSGEILVLGAVDVGPRRARLHAASRLCGHVQAEGRPAEIVGSPDPRCLRRALPARRRDGRPAQRHRRPPEAAARADLRHPDRLPGRCDALQPDQRR